MVKVGGSTRTLGKIMPLTELPTQEFMNVLGELYETLLREDRWPDVLAHLADLFDATEASFLEWNNDYSGARYFVSSRRAHTPESESLFREHYALLDPGVAMGRRAPVGGAANCIDWFEAAVVDKNEYYQGFLLPRDLRYRIALKVRGAPDDAAFLFIYRRESEGPFGLRHMRLLGHFDGHLQRLAQLHSEVRKLRSDRQEAIDVLDRQSTAFITVGKDSRVRTVNKGASRLLLNRDGLGLSGGFLEASRPDITRKLRVLIDMACAPAPAAQGACIWLPRSEEKPLLVGIISPGKPDLDSQVYAILAIADPLIAPPMTGRHLVELYGLTSAEARLACDLAEGKSVEAIAVDRKVAISTVRTQLSSTLKKCSVERQVDLVRLLCRLPSLGRGN